MSEVIIGPATQELIDTLDRWDKEVPPLLKKIIELRDEMYGWGDHRLAGVAKEAYDALPNFENKR